MTDETLVDTMGNLLDALRLLSPAISPNEEIGAAIERAPAGHPVREIARRTVKCRSCGGLMPFYQINFGFDDEGMKDAYCRHCSSSDLVMWQPAVAGHA